MHAGRRDDAGGVWRRSVTEVSELVSADAMEKLHSQVSVSVVQPKLYKILGMKSQLGTLDKLVEEIRKVYSDMVTKLKADTAKEDQSLSKLF
jgi:hypothetical protein